jgi:hypothetical protein
MGLLGRAVLAFSNDVAAGHEDDWTEWHDREHVPERLAIPGFLRLRRYVALGPGPRFFFFYETEDAAVLQSPGYLERLGHPTPWTRACVGHVRNNTRTVCRVTTTLGRGIGGMIAMVETGPAGERAEELRRWLGGTALPAALARPGIVGAHLAEADAAATATKAEEKRLLPTPDAVVRWLVLVEGVSPEAVEAACGHALPPEALHLHGAAGAIVSGLYRLHLVMDPGS